MSLTITLRCTDDQHAEAWVSTSAYSAGVLLATFRPTTLLVDHPWAPESVVPADPREYGQRLWAALGGTALKPHLHRLPRAPDMRSLIVLRIDHDDLAAIPWEYVHTGEYPDSFLILDYLLVREVPHAPLPAPPEPTQPWRLVVMGSNPLLKVVQNGEGPMSGYSRMPRFDVESELGTLLARLYSQHPSSSLPLHWHRIAPTRDTLVNLITSELTASEPILFHYTGHATVEQGQPVLCFDDGTGQMAPQSVRELATAVRGRVYLAVLNACRMSGVTEPGGNLALALVKHGIPAVLHTQYSVFDNAAVTFADTFYQHLARNNHPSQALYHVRRHLHDLFRNAPHLWAMPALFLSQSYQWPKQHVPSKETVPIDDPPLKVAALPEPDLLLGRDRDLVELAGLFVREHAQIITIRGTGGIGKTALAHALASRLRFYFRDGVFALSLMLPAVLPVLHAASVRAALAHIVGIGSHPAFLNPDAVLQQEEAILHAVIERRRLLLILDNYETVLWRLGFEYEAAMPGEATLFMVPPTLDLYTAYKMGIRRLLESTHQKAEYRKEVKLTNRQLIENIDQARHQGETPELKATRAQILEKLNQIARHLLAMSFIELCGLSSTSTLLSPTPDQQYLEAFQIQRLVRKLAERGVHFLFTTRQALIGLPGEISYPGERQAYQLGGLDEQSSIELFCRHSGARAVRAAFATRVADAVGYNPLAIQLAASRWGRSEQNEEEFLQSITRELLKAGLKGVPDELWYVVANVRLTLNALPAHLLQKLLMLSIIANPLIQPAHARVIFEPGEHEHRLSSQMHHDLEQLRHWSLLQGRGTSERTTRAEFYMLQPMIAQVVRTRAERVNLNDARNRYARWAASYVDYLFEVGQPDLQHDTGYTLRLPDLIAALSGLADEQRGWTMWKAARICRKLGYTVESHQILALAEAAGRVSDDHRLMNRILSERASMLLQSGALDEAMQVYEQALAISEAEEDGESRAATLHEMAYLLGQRGALQDARQLYQQALDLNESLGNLRGKAAAFQGIGALLLTQGDPVGAMYFYQQALELQETQSDRLGKSLTLYGIGNVLVQRGELDAAMHSYEQALDLQLIFGMHEEQDATLHQMAQVLIQRGDLDGALRLYLRALELAERHDALHRRASALRQVSQVQFLKGDRDIALCNARESLRLFEQLRMLGEIAQLQETVSQMEAAMNPINPPDLGLVRLAGRLVTMTTAALRGQQPRDQVRVVLVDMPADGLLAPYIDALVGALDGASWAAAELLAAAGPLLADGVAPERADAYTGIANVAALVNDTKTQLIARQEAIAAQRQADDDRESLTQLSVMLYNLAMLYQQLGEVASAVPLLQEVVRLDERIGHPDLASDRAALEAAQLQSDGPRAAIEAWRYGNRDSESLMALMNLISSLTIKAIRESNLAERETLAYNLAHLRAARPLPIDGADEFLHVLQLWLYGEAGMAEQAHQLRRTLPVTLAQTLSAMEHVIATKPDMVMVEDSSKLNRAELAGQLLAYTMEALYTKQPLEQVSTTLRTFSTQESLVGYRDALLEVLNGEQGAIATLLRITERLMASDTDWWVWGGTLMGVAQLANLRNDPATELSARQAAIATFRQDPDSSRRVKSLRTALHKLATFHYERREYSAYIPLMEEIVRLDEQLNGRYLESDRAALQAVKQKIGAV